MRPLQVDWYASRVWPIATPILRKDRGAQGDLSIQDGRDRSSPSGEDAPNNGSTPVDPGANTSTAGLGSVNQRAEIILRSVRQLQMIASQLQMIVAEESSAMEVESSARL